MALAGPKDSPLRRTSPEMDLGSPSIWVDSTGQHIGLNKTELRRTGHTCFVKIKIEHLKCLISSIQQKKHQTSFLALWLCLPFIPHGAGGGIKDAACRVRSVEFLLGVFSFVIC